MSIQNKKGFTLIELMVVIVIIGILAAIAIPKLFGMTAKAKAQEVGPAVGTWVKLQQAYKMETGEWGNPKQISYKLPAGNTGDLTSFTTNFGYTITEPTAGVSSGKWEAESKFDADDCKQGKKWSGEFNATSGTETPEMVMDDEDNCRFLTPNFFAIGCGGSDTNKDKPCSGDGGGE
jgi:prepilin-type N-terminal cleavage/methylation domain-containing protein